MVAEKLLAYMCLDHVIAYLTGYIPIGENRAMTFQEAKEYLYAEANCDQSRIARLDDYFSHLNSG